MSQTSKELIVEAVNHTADRLKDVDVADRREIEEEALDVEVTAGLDGRVRSITLVLGTGGPHIELDVTRGKVVGYWASESHDAPVHNKPLMDALHDFYEMLWDENIIA